MSAPHFTEHDTTKTLAICLACVGAYPRRRGANDVT